MKANELRIGNLFHYKMRDSLDERKEWNEVSQIDLHDLMFLEKCPNDKDFEPIALTEEWLIKFGFDKTKNGYYNYPIEIRLLGTVMIGNNGSFRNIGLKIKYVHELQNLYFALTGEELKLKENG